MFAGCNNVGFVREIGIREGRRDALMMVMMMNGCSLSLMVACLPEYQM